MENKTALNISSLEYFYRHQWTGQKIRALHPFSLEILQGECFGFLGHNGAGKTTTIKLILDLIRPSSGEIELFGINSRDYHSRQQVGYVAEQPYFYDHLTVREIVEMYAALSGIQKSEVRKEAEKSLARIGLTTKLDQPMRSLSKGLIQRVAIAQAICHQPKLLILDEPFSGLDPLGRKEVRDLLLELKESGCTIFISSHILSDVEALCDRASIMVKGELKRIFDIKNTSSGMQITLAAENSVPAQILENLKPDKLSGKANNILFYKDRHQAQAALANAINSGLKIESFDLAHTTLEEIFMDIVKSQQ